MNYTAIREALKQQGGARPKRVFVVYDRSETDWSLPKGMAWRWRLISTTNWSIVGGSQESFDKRGNAIRAARKEASFYRTAGVVVL